MKLQNLMKEVDLVCQSSISSCIALAHDDDDDDDYQDLHLEGRRHSVVRRLLVDLVCPS